MNGILMEKLKSKEELSLTDEREIEMRHGAAALKQARRMVNQSQREANLRRVIETDHGFLSDTKAEMRVTPDMFYADGYLEAVWEVAERAKANGVAGVTIDGCLRLIGIREDNFVAEGGARGVAHLLYHIRHDDVPPLVSDEDPGADEHVVEELEAIRKEPPILDLIEQNLRGQWGTPLTVGLRKHVPDLIMGRVRIFVQFDLDAFMTLAMASGVQLNLATRRDLDEACKKLGIPAYEIFGTRGVRGVKATFEDGEITYLSGFFGRMINDFVSPTELIEMIRREPEQMRKGAMPERKGDE